MPLWLITIKIYAHIRLEVATMWMLPSEQWRSLAISVRSVQPCASFSIKMSFSAGVCRYSWSPSNHADLLPKHCSQSGSKNACEFVWVCESASLQAYECVLASFTIFHQALCCQAVLYSMEPFDQSQGIEFVSAAWRTATTPLPGASSL